MDSESRAWRDPELAAGKPGGGAVDIGADVPGPASMDEFLAGVEHKAYRIARYSIWDHELALDIVQDAMLRLVAKYAQRPATEWAPLFFTILNNRINDARRRWAVREAGGRVVSLFRSAGRDGEGEEVDLLETGYGGMTADRRGEPDALLANRQLGQAIDQALTTLSDRQRQVFVLREWQGLDVKQTAAVLGCSEGSVKQHHFRAMRAIRKQLAEEWKDE
jgi:RNA polymerase sigma-70 factor (ECF subfamily)